MSVDKLENRTTWAEWKTNQLMEKGRENWDEDDWESYSYIQEAEAEEAADQEYLDNYSVYY